MIVTPHDEETAKKVWMTRFNFRPPRDRDQPPDSPSRLLVSGPQAGLGWLALLAAVPLLAQDRSGFGQRLLHFA